jgi:DNA polymerase
MSEPEQLEYLKSLGIPLWVPKDFQLSEVTENVVPAVAETAVPEEPQQAPEIQLAESPAETAELDWPALSTMVENCMACGLHASRSQPVFGVGNQQADIMVIGEAPSADEDKQGEPFVGGVGLLLNQMLQAINYPRESVYIANIVKCRPPDDRNPHKDETSHCATYLHRQIALVAPKVILAVGKVAAENLLQTDLPVGKMRGNQYHYAALNIPVIVTYHPAYLLRSPKEKRKSWEDLKQLRDLLK